MATQLVSFLAYFIPAFLIWLGFIKEWFPSLNGAFSHSTNLIILYSPFYIIGMLMLYAASTVAYGVITFNDVESERVALMEEVALARANLMEKKII
uniref:Dolichol-phosphate mannosyltransferase subunit 3 n=1 Tax=Rhabditophanes sp. KR3021 TaxID=114890 RepID=A0AC35UIA9_9BILA